MSAVNVFIVIFFMIFIWLVYYSILQRKNKKELKKMRKEYEELQELPNNDERKDLSKLGEEFGRKLREAEQVDTIGRRIVVEDTNPPKRIGNGRRKEIPIPTPSVPGKDSNSRRKPSSNSKGFFGKLLRGYRKK